MSIELDKKDKKILQVLEEDCRLSLKQIGKRAGLSPETTFHRIKNLEKSGIIKRYIAHIDVYRIGYEFYSVLIKLQHTNRDIEEEIYSYLRSFECISWLTKCDGNWDINLTILSRGLADISFFQSQFFERFGQFIDTRQVFPTQEVISFKRGYLADKKNDSVASTGITDKIAISEDDLSLLKLLSCNARSSLSDLGRKLGISHKNVAYKIKKLQKEKIIQGFGIQMDYSKIGYKFYKVWFALRNMDNKSYAKLIYYCKANENIIWCTRLIGCYDLAIELEVKDQQCFRDILDDIKGKFGQYISKHESVMIFEESLLTYFPE